MKIKLSEILTGIEYIVLDNFDDCVIIELDRFEYGMSVIADLCEKFSVQGYGVRLVSVTDKYRIEICNII